MATALAVSTMPLLHLFVLADEPLALAHGLEKPHVLQHCRPR